MDAAESHARLQLALTPYIGPVTFFRLLAHFGSAVKVLQADPASLLPLLERTAALNHLHGSATEQALQAALNWQQQPNCHLLVAGDPRLPDSLHEGTTAPAVLFARGDLGLLQRPMVAMVGSRHATPAAEQTAEAFARELAQRGIVVISGLAAGIDAAAHRGALAATGATIAVLGTGIDRVYPAHNRELAHQVAATGLLLSEFALGTPPNAVNFPRRNRIIAALAEATLVVEATLESGSLITAQLAAEMGREVMAVPGSIHNPHSKGCHLLIKQGAKLVECIEDILQECPQCLAASERSTVLKSSHAPAETGLPEADAHPSDAPTEPPGSRPALLLRHMGYDAVHPDELAQKLGIPAADVYAELLALELSGHIAPVAGGRYQRLSE